MRPEESLSKYIEIGAIEIAGVEENGEFIFNVTPEAEYLAPELWEAHHNYVDKMMIDLFEKGLLNISYDENLNAYIELTEEGRFIARQQGIIETES
jgi:hypothetical protein